MPNPLYIYIYIERERCVSVCVCVCNLETFCPYMFEIISLAHNKTFLSIATNIKLLYTVMKSITTVIQYINKYICK